MTILEVIAIIVFILICTLLFAILRAFVIYSICKDMPEDEQDEFLKEVEKAEAEQLNKDKFI